MNVIGMNSLNPPVSSCIWRRISICSTRSSIVSTWPYIMVAEPSMPALWASLIIRIHSSVLTLLGHTISLVRSFKISAAVPGMVPRPAFFKILKASAVGISLTFAASAIIVGENPWISTCGKLDFNNFNICS